MTDAYWLRQNKDKPLFEDLIWSKPETKSRAGKLLIIGGSSSGFSRPAEAYNQASKAGVGSIKVAMPLALMKTVSAFIEDAVFCPSNISGSLAKESLAELLDYALWSDMVLLAGDLSHNSETAVLFESFISKYKGPLTISDDSIDLFITNPSLILNREDSVLVLSLNKLQKLLVKAGSTEAVSLSSNLIQTVAKLEEISKQYKASIVTKHQDSVLIAMNGLVSTTECSIDKWEVGMSSYAAVWALQNPTKQFEALTTAAYEFLI